MADERKRNRWPFVGLALLVMYPLSMGPANWLWVNGYMSTETAQWLGHHIYRPVTSLMWEWDAFGRFMRWYIPLWIHTNP